MQWTVQVIVVLLNIAWIAFFLQPDPFSVFVQRRSSDSSDEEMLFRQFCIQPHPDMNWALTVHSANITPNKTNSTNTTAEERGPRKLTTKTSTQPNDIHTSQSSDIDLTSPSPGSTPQQIMWTQKPSSRSKPQLTFVTVKSRRICVDPEVSWVQSIMGSLDKGSS